MPTKPHRMTLDEAVARSAWQEKPITRRRASIAAYFGILLGFTGIHNLIMRRKKRALAHALSSAVAFAMFLGPLLYVLIVVYKCQHPAQYECPDISGYDDTLNVIMIIGMILSALALLWGFVEGVVILLNRNRFKN